jgi:hypothetical protein
MFERKQLGILALKKLEKPAREFDDTNKKG